MTILQCPHYALRGVSGPQSIEWTNNEAVATTQSPFTGAVKTYDWGASWWSAQVSFNKMDRRSYSAWSAFLLACRGGVNTFLLGDPKARYPLGSALGTPTVNGAQTGYSLVTAGWQASQQCLFFAGDYIQIGNRLYRITANVASDSTGAATLPIWPNLRADNQVDALPIITRDCKGLFKLKPTATTGSVTTDALWGIGALEIIEAI
ncbi:hypothetical protein ACOBR2_06425 [Telmatobacter bradus]|uniref:hypothetical protein n=1 Tax=Telmatobacter bradus TaxID=474953 RepID=UPI003B437787